MNFLENPDFEGCFSRKLGEQSLCDIINILPSIKEKLWDILCFLYSIGKVAKIITKVLEALWENLTVSLDKQNIKKPYVKNIY